MKPKKNTDKDLNKRRSFYFVGSLVVVLSGIYFALEWKTAPNNYGYDTKPQYHNENQIEKPKVVLSTKAKSDSTRHLIRIFNKERDHEAINSKTADKTKTHDDALIIPFSVLDAVPIFPGCENKKDKRACFNRMMQRHIRKHFKYPQLNHDQQLQSKIPIRFIIMEDGSIKETKTEEYTESLKREITRIIKKLPKLTPARHHKKNVRTSYYMPLIICIN